MDNVVRLDTPQPEPEPTESRRRCQCGHDRFELWAYGVVACGECKEIQAVEYRREGK